MLKCSQRLADAVKNARLELGLTQEEVADKCDTDVRTKVDGMPFFIMRSLPKISSNFFHPLALIDMEGTAGIAVAAADAV